MVHGLSPWSCQILGWFSNQNDNSFVTIPLPKEIMSWIGCALSVGLVVHQDFDLSCDLKVKHVFDCYSNGGVWNKQTLFHEINVRDVPFPGRIMYWISIPYIWFSQRCNAFNECTSITASTIIDSPYVKVEKSGNRLLYNLQDFVGFTLAIERIRKNEKNNSGQLIKMARTEQQRQVAPLTEQQRQVAPLTEQLESLPSDLECYQCRNFCGSKWYVIEGKLNHPWTATLLGEILQEYSIQNHLFYRSTFTQFEIPEWFYSVNGSAATIPLYPSFDMMKGWKGIAVCAAFTVHRHPSLILENLDPENLFIEYNLVAWGLGQFSLRSRILEILIHLKGSGFIWISYASLQRYAPWNECTSMNLQFYSNNKDVTVQSCGYQVVFDQNMEELIQTIMQCSTTSEYQLSKTIKTQQSVAYYDDDDDVNDDDKDDDDDDNVDDVNTPWLYSVIQAMVSKLPWPLNVICFQFLSYFSPT
ncbi:hypothetical protein M0R45_001867 [Rubus argutus]|uniref:Uncharacterized protein n=1 Tax=Rubus argutus TaxID=59490 RepID=A0AAW1VKV4_RUBAR